MPPGRSTESKELLAESIRDLLAKELYVEKDMVSVSIEDVPLEKWEESMTKINPDTIYIQSK